MEIVSFPKASESSLMVVCSRPPRKITLSMLPTIVSAWSLYRAFSWLCACKNMVRLISRERMTATIFSSWGTWPVLAASSHSTRT